MHLFGALGKKEALISGAMWVPSLAATSRPAEGESSGNPIATKVLKLVEKIPIDFRWAYSPAFHKYS